MTTQERIDTICENFWGKFAWCDLQSSEDNKRMDDWLRTTLAALVDEVREEAYKAGYIKGGIDEQITYNLSLEKIRAEEMERVKKWLTLNAIAFTTQKQEEDFLAFLSAPTKTDNQ